MSRPGIRLLRPRFAIASLPVGEPIPAALLASPWFCVTRTDHEISLLCFEEHAPGSAVEVEPGWRAFEVDGPLSLDMVGLIAELSGVLAGDGVAILPLATFRTDYVFVRDADVVQATIALAKAGFPVR